MNILVTGGCGYKGSILVPKLLAQGYKVTVLDTMWFGNFLEPHDDLTVINGDVRNAELIDLKKVDTIIHLSSVANDPCGDLDPKLTWEISALATMQLADKAARNGVGQFIYASSGSVYGIKEEANVTEDLELKPISEYNKTKMVSEKVLESYSDKMVVQIIRPATVCGYSPRMRLDVAVNLLTMQALTRNKITVLGGQQTRPNIHIDDIADVYLHMIEKGSDAVGVFNAGFENLSILDIAKLVVNEVEAEIVIEESNDPRSYRVDSSKLLATGFTPKKSIAHAISEMVDKYKNGTLRDDRRSYNLTWMQEHVL